MKHNLKITAILLSMFILTQLIGIYVVNYYSSENAMLPFDLDSQQIDSSNPGVLPSIIFAFIIAIFILFLFMKLHLKFILRAWFFLVMALSLAIAFNVFTNQLGIEKFYIQIPIIATLIAIPLAIMKISGKSFIVHNFTEFLIYPGIAAVFVPLLNVWTIIALLILISLYDAWAVWHSGIMQKMAKYQIDTLKVFSGFFVPYASKKVKAQIAKMKKSMTKNQLKKKKFRVSVAILGGGDIVFPIITAGVMLGTPFGLGGALLVVLGATLGLAYLFFAAEKRKFYPAMPFISAGIFLGILVSYLIL